jgi:hypothetical protein
MTAGHASGVAATIAAKANSAIQNVEMAALQAKLAAQGQLLRLKDGDEGK